MSSKTGPRWTRGGSTRIPRTKRYKRATRASAACTPRRSRSSTRRAGPQYLLGISEDITEYKQAEEALRAAEQRLATVVSNLPVVVFALDPKGVFTLSEGLRPEGAGPAARRGGGAVGV